MKILIDLGPYDETPTVEQALADTFDLISMDITGAAEQAELVD